MYNFAAAGVQFKCRRCSTSLPRGVQLDRRIHRRIFTPIDRASLKWQRYYDKRTAVERVNIRLDESFGFEKHYIREKTKMEVRCGIALSVMLAMTVGWIKKKQEDRMRSLVKPA